MTPRSAPGAQETDEGAEETKATKPRERRRLAGIDPCSLHIIQGEAWLDRLNRGLHRAVCESALWFDDLFGDDLAAEDRGGTYGRLLVGLEYNDLEEIDDVNSFHAEFELPNAERRLSGFVGRGDRDELVGDQQPRTGALPNRAASLPDDDEWLIGLGYSPHRSSRRSSWSYDVGADLEFPINWFAKARHKYVLFPSDTTMLRLRQSFFWEHDKGWGYTTRADYDHLLPKDRLLRWRNIGRISESDSGIDWYTELTLFTNLGERRALAYQLLSSGETDGEVPLEYVAARVIYRQSVLREWFFVDVRPGLSYRREPGRDRKIRPVLAFGFEILFGKLEN